MKNFSVFLVFFLFSNLVKAQSFYNPYGRTEHMLAGGVIGVTTFVLAERLFPQSDHVKTHLIARKISLGTIFVAALGREIYDYYKYKNRNAWNDATLSDGIGDFITTCVAGMTVVVVVSF